MPQTKRQKLEGIVRREMRLEVVKRDAPAQAEGEPDGNALPDNMELTFSFASDEPVLRTPWWDDPWIEVLGMTDAECDLTRLSSGAPVLANHGMTGAADSPLLTIGTTTKAWIEGGRGMVNVKLSRRDGMEGLIQDIQDGIVSNVSVGYVVNERTLVKSSVNEPDEYRVTSWTPMEVSLVDIPADATVGIGRSAERHGQGDQYRVVDLPESGSFERKEQAMPQAQTESGASPDISPEVRDAIVAGERQRASDIRTAVRAAGLDESIAVSLIDGGISIDAARATILEKLAERTAAQQVTSRADIVTVRDETETRRTMMSEAILHRYDSKQQLSEGARQYRGMSLIELARDCLEAQGIRTRGMDRMAIAGRAFEGLSDFPAILANVANKTLRQAYLAAPRTFTVWAKPSTNPDFKQISRTALSDAPSLEIISDNGEFKRGSFTDGKETYQLATFGKVVGISRQAIINDDLNAFTRIPSLMAAASANLESDTVYSILTTNAPLINDNVALFHATHKNLAGTAAAIAVPSLGAARSAMRIQKTPQGAVTNLVPKYLIVPSALELVANQYTSQNYVATKQGDYNPFSGSLTPVVEGRLDANSATAWYLAADNSLIDTVEYCYLEGQEGAYLETKLGFDVDGMEIKVRLDFAAKALDFRGLYKNAGA